MDRAAPSKPWSHAKDPFDPAVADTYGLHDASYYKGAFYLYFWSFPGCDACSGLFGALTGRYLSEAQAVVIFSDLGFAVSLCLALST